MSLTTFIGVLLGFGLFIGAVMLSTDNYWIFLNFPSLVMVTGGVFSSTLISYEIRYVWLAIKSIGFILITPKVGRYLLNFDPARSGDDRRLCGAGPA